MKNRSKRKHGFTLIESVVSFAIFTIMMGGIYSIIINSINTNKDGEVKQQAAIDGQQIFEEFRSSNIQKISGTEKYSFGKFELTKSNDIYEGNKDLGKNYSAHVVVEKNNSINLNKGLSSNEKKPYDFYFDIKTESNFVNIKYTKDNEQKITLNSDDNLEFTLESKTENNKKNISIKNNDKSLYYSMDVDNFLFNSNQIKITLNFMNYSTKLENNNNKYKPITINVYNKDNDFPLNIVLEKSKDIETDFNAKEGTFRLYDNREYENTTLGELYTVTVTIKNKWKSNEEKEVFNCSFNQNIIIGGDN